jgi:hypothetical protein
MRCVTTLKSDDFICTLVEVSNLAGYSHLPKLDRLWDPPSASEALSLGVEWTRREADHSIQSTADVKDEFYLCSCIFLHGKQKKIILFTE